MTILQEIDSDVWVAQQPLTYFGLSIRTRMTVVRLKSNELVIISPIRLEQTVVEQLNRVGQVRHIIAPNLYHYMFVSEMAKCYPEAILWATQGLREKVPSLPISKLLGEDETPFSPELQHILFEGFRTLVPSGAEPLNEYIFFHLATRTLIVTDAAFNFDRTFPWLTQLVARVSGIHSTLSPSLLEKIATTEREKVKKSVKSILKWDFDRVIMAHGSVVASGGKTAFSNAYRFVY